jgi:hypothetical protein
MILVPVKKMLPDCVDYLRPYQLIKFNLNLFVHFLGCDCYQQGFYQNTSTIFTYTIYSVHKTSIRMYVIL